MTAISVSQRHHCTKQQEVDSHSSEQSQRNSAKHDTQKHDPRSTAESTPTIQNTLSTAFSSIREAKSQNANKAWWAGLFFFCAINGQHTRTA
eukprot:m.481819 g.481819  ORF g.481819 m.481819 type:complete len:92 (-) comp57917_c0_seq1:90-365(-)